MAHKARINGTNYSVIGGKCRVNGTNYSIKKGRTRVNGTNYDISFGEPADLYIDVWSQFNVCEIHVYVNDIRIDILSGELKNEYVTQHYSVRIGDEIRIYFYWYEASWVDFDQCSGFSDYQFVNDNEFNGVVSSDNPSVYFTIYG